MYREISIGISIILPSSLYCNLMGDACCLAAPLRPAKATTADSAEQRRIPWVAFLILTRESRDSLILSDTMLSDPVHAVLIAA
jgi:hypothetical protein